MIVIDQGKDPVSSCKYFRVTYPKQLLPEHPVCYNLLLSFEWTHPGAGFVVRSKQTSQLLFGLLAVLTPESGRWMLSLSACFRVMDNNRAKESRTGVYTSLGKERLFS